MCQQVEVDIMVTSLLSQLQCRVYSNDAVSLLITTLVDCLKSLAKDPLQFMDTGDFGVAVKDSNGLINQPDSMESILGWLYSCQVLTFVMDAGSCNRYNLEKSWGLLLNHPEWYELVSSLIIAIYIEVTVIQSLCNLQHLAFYILASELELPTVSTEVVSRTSSSDK